MFVPFVNFRRRSLNKVCSCFLFRWRGKRRWHFFAILAIASLLPSPSPSPFILLPFQRNRGQGRMEEEEDMMMEKWGGRNWWLEKCSTWLWGASFGTLGSHVSVPKINSSKITCFQKNEVEKKGKSSLSLSLRHGFFVRAKGQGQKITS